MDMNKLWRGVRGPFHHSPSTSVSPSRARPSAASTPLPHSRAAFGALRVVTCAGKLGLSLGYHPSWTCCTTPPTRSPDRRSAASASPTSMSRDPKPCKTCGREITWRKKWERCWDDVQYCSAGCRKNKPGDEGRCARSAPLQ